MFYRMDKGDAVLLLLLSAFSGAGFLLPFLREAKWCGVSLLGWWMAALMFLGPAAACLRMRRGK